MKKIFLMGAVSALALGACKSDDNDDENKVTILGTWKPVSTKIYSGVNNSTVLYSEVADDCYKNSTIEFKADNTVVSTIYDYIQNNVCTNLGAETYAYGYNESAGTIIVDGETSHIKTLTNNTLEILDVDFDEDFNNDGVADKMYLVLGK